MIDIQRQEEAFEKLNKNTLKQEIGKKILFKKGPFGSSLTKSMFVEKGKNTYKVYEQKNAIKKSKDIGNYYISDNTYQCLKAFEVFEGDIIVSCAGTIGESYIIPVGMEKGIINQALMIIRIDENKYSKKLYMEFFNKGIKKLSIEKSNGSAIKNIPPLSDLRSMEFPRWNIEKQYIIANFLTSLDSLIQKQEEYIEELKIQKKAYSQKIFSQELRFEGFEDIWELTDLQSISNKIYSGGTPKSSKNEYYNGNIPFLSISDIDNMQINNTQKYISEEGLKNSSSKIIAKNNIIYTMYATPGLAVINKIDVAIPQSVMGIELTGDNDKSYVCNYLNYKRDDILAYGMTGTQTNLTGQIVKEMAVEVPKESEQKKIGDFLSLLDDKIELQEQKLERLKLKKKYYLNKIFQ